MKITRKMLAFLELADKVNPRCRKFPDLFFPEDYAGEEYEEAKKKAVIICERCPIQKQCLEYALEADEEYGIWGGKTAAARKYGRG